METRREPTIRRDGPLDARPDAARRASTNGSAGLARVLIQVPDLSTTRKAATKAPVEPPRPVPVEAPRNPPAGEIATPRTIHPPHTEPRLPAPSPSAAKPEKGRSLKGWALYAMLGIGIGLLIAAFGTRKRAEPINAPPPPAWQSPARQAGTAPAADPKAPAATAAPSELQIDLSVPGAAAPSGSAAQGKPSGQRPAPGDQGASRTSEANLARRQAVESAPSVELTGTIEPLPADATHERAGSSLH
jgi:hypothetical protein